MTVQPNRVLTDEQVNLCKAALAILGESQLEYAARTGLSHFGISKYINGRVVLPQRYADAFTQLLKDAEVRRTELIAA